VTRCVVITGAAGGLGRVTAETFASGGDRVFVCDADAVATMSLRQAGTMALSEVVDVADRRQLEGFFEIVRSMTDHVDVLINNVGVAGPRAPLEEVDPREWDDALNANLNSAYWAMRQVLGDMKSRRSGTILNISTVSVATRPVNRAPYVVSKAALESLTLAIAREAGPYNVRCNAIRPGLMNNERLHRIFQRIADQQNTSIEEVESEQLRYVSMHSKVEMTQVAALLHFLASQQAAHITAQIIGIDGDMQWET
jgi:NAD(P)-dependent dehydrogenase (short-subunit alcohol dehydrogenase family)